MVCCCSVSKSCPTLCDPMDCRMPGSSISQSLLKFMSIESMILSNHPILSHPLLLLASALPSIRVFSNESAVHLRWPKYWSFSLHRPARVFRLISCRIDWFDLLAVQGTFKSLLQHHSLKTSVLQHSVFFMVPFSHLCMAIGKHCVFD